MRVIVPCAGRSSRFPNTRPKYLLTMPDGELMLQHVVRNWIEDYPVVVVINREHEEQYRVVDIIERIWGKTVSVHIVEHYTNGPAETIYETIRDWDDTPFYVQDCDSLFNIKLPAVNRNFVAHVNLNDYPTLTNIAAKSFVTLHEELLTNIVEKRLISDNICVGGYGFHSSYGYRHHYELLVERQGKDSELFISHVIKTMMENGCIFGGVRAINYLDCGTYESFIENQKRHATIFCDLDGVVFYNQSRYFENNYSIEPKLKPQAVSFLLGKQENGAHIVFTTARPSGVAGITEAALDAAGFKDYRILYDLPHAPRMLINDVSASNPWPSAIAINSPRDDDDYWKAIQER